MPVQSLPLACFLSPLFLALSTLLLSRAALAEESDSNPEQPSIWQLDSIEVARTSLAPASRFWIVFNLVNAGVGSWDGAGINRYTAAECNRAASLEIRF